MRISTRRSFSPSLIFFYVNQNSLAYRISIQDGIELDLDNPIVALFRINSLFVRLKIEHVTVFLHFERIYGTINLIFDGFKDYKTSFNKGQIYRNYLKLFKYFSKFLEMSQNVFSEKLQDQVGIS